MKLWPYLRAVPVAGLAFLLLVPTASGQEGDEDATMVDPTAEHPTELPAGTYSLDPAHASLVFRVDHLGFSRFTARFTRFDATLDFDPADPESMQVTAAVDATSIETDYPDPDSYDFNADLQGETWLDTGRFPEITFRSTDVTRTGAQTADVTGDLALRGVTHPVTLDVTFNGGYPSHPLDPDGSRIGFSARTTLSRSDFGIGFGLPPEGSRLGVGDEIEIVLETEFLRPLDEAPDGQ